MSSPRYGHPEAHRAFGRDIMYTIILYYILLYIELRESQTATITPPCCSSPRTALHWVWRLNADWLLLTHVTQWPRCWTLIGCHHTKFTSKLKYLNSSEFVEPQILVNALACARRKCGVTNQNLSPVFPRKKIARYASLCMGSCRPVAFGANAHIASFHVP